MSRPPAKRSVSPARKSRRAKALALPVSSSARTSPKLAAFVRKHWPAQGRAERIERAEKAWSEAMEIASTFKKSDLKTVKWIAEDPDLEYL